MGAHASREDQFAPVGIQKTAAAAAAAAADVDVPTVIVRRPLVADRVAAFEDSPALNVLVAVFGLAQDSQRYAFALNAAVHVV